METLDTGFQDPSKKPLLPIQQRKKFVLISLGILLALDLLMTITQVVFYQKLKNVYSTFDFTGLQSTALLVGGIAMVFIVAFIVTAVAIPVWFYRANQNLHLGGVKHLEFTSGWSAGWFFVPFANLVMPVKVLGEIFRGTAFLHGEVTERWKNHPIPAFITLWWLFYILSGISSNIASSIAEANNAVSVGQNYDMIIVFELVSLIFSLVSAFSLFKVITVVSDKQEKIRLFEN